MSDTSDSDNSRSGNYETERSKLVDWLQDIFNFHMGIFDEYGDGYEDNEINEPIEFKVMIVILDNLSTNNDKILLNDYLYRLFLNYNNINVSKHLYKYELITFLDDDYILTNYNRIIFLNKGSFINKSTVTEWGLRDLDIRSTIQQLSNINKYLHMNYDLYNILFNWTECKKIDDNIKRINQNYVQNNFNENYYDYDEYNIIEIDNKITDDVYQSFFAKDEHKHVIHNNKCFYIIINVFT